MEDKMKTIRQRMKEAHDKKKIYVDADSVDCSYEVGD
jgi:hypothetical protein